mmetsp:Transcript_33948/g.133187  ORF Transcript_33948/g.133187 Transcript_33948/m.133187 type:complete len:600 (-) Transcript_33948:42-1841(-)
MAEVDEVSVSSAGSAQARRDATRAPSTLEVMLRSHYPWLLVLRLLCICLPGFIQRSEFAEGQEAVYKMFFHGGTEEFLDVPADMLGDDPKTSIVPALITSFVPYAVAKALLFEGEHSMWAPVITFLLPRVWMFFLSIVLDFLTLECLNLVGGQGRLEAAGILATSWASLVIAVRPSKAIVEAIAVSGCMASLLSVRRDVFKAPAFLIFYALGVFCRSSFFMYGLILLYFLGTMVMKPNPSYEATIAGIFLGAIVFLFEFASLAALDSFYYGKLSLVMGGVTYENLTGLVQQMQEGGVIFSFPGVIGSLMITPFHSMTINTLREFRVYLARSISAGQMFVSFPLLVGPFAAILCIEAYDSVRRLFKEVMSEVKGAQKKRKTKKVPELAKSREEEESIYSDTVEMMLTLGLTVEAVFGSGTAGLLSVFPLLAPCILMFHEKIFGAKAFKGAWKWWIAYNMLAVLFFGFLHNSGPVRLATGLAHGEMIEPAGSPPTIYFYKTYKPANYLLHDNILDAKFMSLENVTRAENVHPKVWAAQENEPGRKFYVAAPATLALTEKHGYSLVTKYNMHMSLESLPRNLDDVLKSSKMNLYSLVEREGT